MPLHNAFAVRYGASTVIAGLTQLDLQNNPTVESESSSGTPFPQFAVITQQAPRIMFSTKQVGALLGVTGLIGGLIDNTNQLVAVMARLGENGIATSGNARTYTMVRGLLVPRRLQCSARGNLQADAEALSYSLDGSVHPIAISDAGGLPVITQNNVLHTIGPITLGAKAIGCPQSVQIDFGNGANSIGCGGDLYDTHLEVPRVAPVITITGIDAAAFGPDGVPPVGAALTHSDSTIFFRRRTANGIGFVANATAQHIRLTVNGLAVVTQHTGQGTSRAEVTVQITTSWDGTTAPMTINTAAAIA